LHQCDVDGDGDGDGDGGDISFFILLFQVLHNFILRNVKTLFCNVRQRSTKAIVLATRSGRLGVPSAAALAAATFQVELCNNRLLLVSFV